MAVIGGYQGVDINSGTDAEVAAQIAAIDAQKANTTAVTDPAPTDSTNPLTSSSGTSRTKEKKLAKTVTDASNPAYAAPSKDLTYIENYIKRLDERQRNEESSINSSFDSKQSAVADAQKRETGSTSVAIARAGGYLGNSGSGTGTMLSLAETHRADMLKLESLRQQALQQSRDSFADKSFDAAKLYADTAKKIEEETYKRQQDYFEEVKKANDEIDIYNAIVEGYKDPTKIFEKLGGKVAIDDINNFLEKSKPGINGSATFKYTNEDMAHLMGAGFSKDDVDALQAYVEENGYDEKIRATMTPKERAVADSIYYPKAPNGGKGVGGALTIAEATALGLPTTLIGKSEEQVIADINSLTPPNWFKEYVVSGWADQTAEVNPDGLKKLWDEFRARVIAQNVSGNQYEKNAKGTSSGGIDLSSIPDVEGS